MSVRDSRGAIAIHYIMTLPEDNFILLSFINTKLRDEYDSLEQFCDENGLSTEDICARMAQIGYEYDAARNAFK